MKALKERTIRIVGPALALAAVAALALSGIAAAQDHGGRARHRHHHHGHRHKLILVQESGKISSFDATTGKLTVTLGEGESVTGLVTESTEIKCPAPEAGIAQRRDGSGEELGDGGEGEEPGDDNGGDSGQGSSGDDSGEEGDTSGSQSDESGQGSCTTASLTSGAVIGSAELRLEGGKAVFTEIDLGTTSAS